MSTDLTFITNKPGIQLLEVLRTLWRGIPGEYLQRTQTAADQTNIPCEVILSSWIVGGG